MSADQIKNTGMPGKASKSWFRIIIYLLLALFICFAVLFALLPTLASSSWGKKRIETAINAQIPGNVEIGELSLGWFGPQKIQQIVLKSAEGAKILTVSQLSTSASIFSLWNRSRPNSLEVKNLNAVMEVDSAGITNIERALSKNTRQHLATTADPVKIELQNTNIQLDLSGNTDRLAAILAGKTLRNSLQGQFTINAELSGIDSGRLLKTGDLQLVPDSALELNADISNFPVALLDQFLAFERPEAAGILSLLLGEELNGTLKQTATAQGMAFDLNATSPLLNAKLQLNANQRLTLTKPATFDLQVTSELIDKLAKMAHITSSWKLKAPTSLQLSVDRFSSVSGKPFSETNLRDIELVAVAHLKDAVITDDVSGNSMTLHNFQAAAEMTPESKTAKFSVNGDALHNGVPLRINTEIVLDKPLLLKDLPEQLKKQLAANIHIEGDLSQFLDSLLRTNSLLTNSIGNVKSISTVVNMSNGQPVFTTSLQASSLQFSDLTLKFDKTRLFGDHARFSFNIPARDAFHSPLAGSLDIHSFSWDMSRFPKQLQAEVNIGELALNDASRQITHAIDGTFSINLALNDSENGLPKGTVDVDLRNQLLSGKARLEIDRTFKLQPGSNGGSFLLHLTPDNFPLLRSLFHFGSGQAELSLQEPATVQVHFKELNIPLQGKTLVLPHAAMNGSVHIPRLSLASSTARQFVILSDVQMQVESLDVSNQLTFNLQANGGRGYTDDNGKQAGIALNGSMTQVLTSDGSLDPNISLTLNGSADGVPVPLLCELLSFDPLLSKKAQAIVGARANAQVQMQLQKMNGPIYLAVNGTNGNFALDGYLSQGHLNLRRDFNAEVAVTPELGKYVLSDYLPMLGEIVSSESPIKLTISQQGFDLPFYRPTLEQISIGQGTLDLGKIYFANTGLVAKSLKLLAPSNASFLSIWLTPAYFTLSQGVFNLQRVDMLVSDRYPIAAWGSVDFFRDRVNMMLGLSGAAINKAFGVSGVKNKYMLQLPLRGTIKEASIDKSKVAARVSAIVAQSHGGPQGLVLGTILDVASGGLTEAAPPAPTTNPLPWASQYEDPEVEESPVQESQAQPSKSKNPLKQIGKEASNLLKEIFR